MTFHIHPLHRLDSYKLAHPEMYEAVAPGITGLQSNFTARTSRIPDVTKVVLFGLQAYLQDLTEQWDEHFFDRPLDEVVAAHTKRTTELLGAPVPMDRIKQLHDLGYLPLIVCALPEGTEVPLRVPMFTIESTNPRFAWLVNHIETDLSAAVWLTCTSATQALRLRRLLDQFAAETSDTPEFVDWQGHDFSARGMSNLMASAASGAGHLLSFAGSDSVPALDWIEYFYGAPGFIGGSVPASEHSVMCAGGELTELETFRHILRLYKAGIVSVVADTWDFFKVLTETLVLLKSEILSRDGKLVIRPDSGDPVDIICGDPNAPFGSPEFKGAIECLWDVFGGTVNSKGFRQLDEHIGLIYGDSITYERAQAIGARLADKGFVMQPVLGVGSFTYQYVTRDTFGFAMKATWVEVDGEGRSIFKDPKTDNGVKKSAKGRLAVHEIDGELVLINEATPADEARSLLEPVWCNGVFLQYHTFAEIAQRVGVRHLMPA